MHYTPEDAAAAKGGTVDDEEVAKFSAVADEWWDRDGPFHALHQMTDTRVEFVRAALATHYGLDDSAAAPLFVACGGCWVWGRSVL